MKKRPLLTGLTFVGVVAGVLVSRLLISGAWNAPEPIERPPVGPPVSVVPDPLTMATPRLDAAKQKTEQVIGSHILPVRTFFEDSKKNSRHFAEVSLGWGSKWRLIADKIPYSKGGRHESYIREQFEQSIFSPKDVEGVMDSAVSGYLADIRNVENQMLVALRADIAGFPDAYPLSSLDESQLQSKFEAAIQNAIDAAGDELQADIGTQLVSIIGGEVLTLVAIRLGVSAGILGVGAGSSWATLGIGAVVGLIVDQIVSWVWDWWADPTGDLTSKLNDKLDEIGGLICDGDSEVVGLQQRFQNLALERAKIRETAILDMLSSNQGSKK